MKKIKIIGILLVACYFGFSCESSTYDEISAEVANPTYTANVKSIITSNCLGCHSAVGQYPPMETYEQVIDATKNGEVICRIDDQSCGGAVMPQSGRMPQTNINTIKKWVANEYRN